MLLIRGSQNSSSESNSITIANHIPSQLPNLFTSRRSFIVLTWSIAPPSLLHCLREFNTNQLQMMILSRIPLYIDRLSDLLCTRLSRLDPISPTPLTPSPSSMSNCPEHTG